MGYESDIENEYIMLYLGDEANNPTFLENAYVARRLSLWPRWCYNTHKLIWLTWGIRARRFYRTGDHFVANEDRWYTQHEFMMMRLRGIC